MSDRSTALDGFVFVVTYGRSGSTLLQNLLNAIPGYQIRGENNNALFHMMQTWRSVNGSEPLKGMRAAGDPSDRAHPWYGGERIDPNVLGHALADCFIDTVLQPDPETRVSGFKEIRFHTNPNAFPAYLDFIHTFFPNSKFIFNTRDHAAVAKSGWWSNRPAQGVSTILNKAEDLYRAYLDKHPERGLLMHYDDYVKDRAALLPMYAFLEEEFDAQVVDRVFSRKLTHARGKPKRTGTEASRVTQ